MIDLCASGETDLESFVRYRRSVQQLSHPYLARTYIFSLGNRRWFGHSKNVKIEACVYPQTMQYHISKGAFLTLRLPSHGRRILSSSIQLRRRPQLQADWLWICGHMRPWRELGNSCGHFAFRNGLVLLLTCSRKDLLPGILEEQKTVGTNWSALVTALYSSSQLCPMRKKGGQLCAGAMQREREAQNSIFHSLLRALPSGWFLSPGDALPISVIVAFSFELPFFFSTSLLDLSWTAPSVAISRLRPLRLLPATSKMHYFISLSLLPPSILFCLFGRRGVRRCNPLCKSLSPLLHSLLTLSISSSFLGWQDSIENGPRERACVSMMCSAGPFFSCQVHVSMYHSFFHRLPPIYTVLYNTPTVYVYTAARTSSSYRSHLFGRVVRARCTCFFWIAPRQHKTAHPPLLSLAVSCHPIAIPAAALQLVALRSND